MVPGVCSVRVWCVCGVRVVCNIVQRVSGNKQQICAEYPATFHIEQCGLCSVSNNVNKVFRKTMALCGVCVSVCVYMSVCGVVCV